MLNFGCGGTFHADWVNLDSFPASPTVIAHDLATKLPFEEGHFDAVYGSHVLEHFDSLGARNLLADCRRVLKPGGIIRIVVPDLEAIVRLYLECMKGAIAGNRQDQAQYEWILLELFDQMTRGNPGGRMKTFLGTKMDDSLARFVAARLGDEGNVAGMSSPERQPFLWRSMRRMGLEATRMREDLVRAFAFLLLGKRGGKGVREGFFRSSGEIHQWMYDRYSLAQLLEGIGFTGAHQSRAGESGITGFAGYQLEILEGRERKPDSLYMEARKPG